MCGNVNDRIDLMVRTGADSISVDQKVDMLRAKRVASEAGVCVMGNLDPVKIGQGSPEEIKLGALDLISNFSGGGLILSSGCILSYAPLENVRAMVEASRAGRMGA